MVLPPRTRSAPSRSTSSMGKLALGLVVALSLLALLYALPNAMFDGGYSWTATHNLSDLLSNSNRTTALAECDSSLGACSSAQSVGQAESHRPSSAAPTLDDLFPDEPSAISTTAAPSSSTNSAGFGTTSACGVDPSLVAKYGQHSIRLSRAHEGSGYRIQTFLKKLRAGERVKVAVIGGSVSNGHGFLHTKNEYGAIPFDSIWHQEVVRYLRSIAPGGVGQVEYVHGAKSATDSGYFAWCYPVEIGTDADLILVELAVNDAFTPQASDSSETLLRSLLQLPTNPAVMYVDSFSVKNGKAILSGADAHAHLAIRYDVPSISLRAAVLSDLIRRPKLVKPFFNGDQTHIALPGHAMLGNLVVAYLQEEGCRLEEGGWDAAREEWGPDESHSDLPGLTALGEVPRVRMSEFWASPGSPLPASPPPTCSLAAPPGTAHELLPTSDSPNWSLLNWEYSKFYIQTTTSNAEPITFNVTVLPGSAGTVALGYLRSKEYGLGKVRCGVEGYGERVLDGWWKSSLSLLQVGVISSGVAEGVQVVRCETLRREEQSEGRVAFRIMSLMSV